MRDKAIEILKKHGISGYVSTIIDAMIDFANQETEALQTRLNNERKMNESHVNTLLKQIEDKNKTNL